MQRRSPQGISPQPHPATCSKIKETIVGAVLHFMSDQMQRSACGAKVFLCSDYTDDPRYVDCKRCQRATSFKEYDPQRFDVDIWNHEGDVIRWFRSVTA